MHIDPRGVAEEHAEVPIPNAVDGEGADESRTGPRILVVNEAGFDDSHLGHRKLNDVLMAGLGMHGWTVEYLEVPRPALVHRAAMMSWPLLRRWDADLQQLRWHVVMGWITRRRLLERLGRGPAVDIVLVHTHSIAFLIPSLDRPRVVLSADTGTRVFRKFELWRRRTRVSSFSEALTEALERRAIRRHDGVLAWSEWSRQSLPTSVGVTVWHPGLSDVAHRPSGKDPRRVLFVGGRFEAKGGHLLLEVLQPFLDSGRVLLDIVTQDEVAPEAPNVTVHRLGPGPELDRLFARAGLFMLPSAGDAVPWVVLEALRMGTPVMGSDVGAIGELIGEGCGWVLPPRDVAAWRAAVETYLSTNGSDASDRAQRCRASWSERFDVDVNAARLDELLRRILDYGKSPR
jgi:glycosyltransferase involved in cell wall biosynthesis